IYDLIAYTLMTRGSDFVGQTIKLESALERKRLLHKKTFGSYVKLLLLDKHLLIFFIGFLLGRAVILYTISPFAIALLATAWAGHQKRILALSFFTVLGAFSNSVEQGVFIGLAMAVFYIQTRFLKNRMNLRFLMPFVFIATTATRIGIYS